MLSRRDALPKSINKSKSTHVTIEKDVVTASSNTKHRTNRDDLVRSLKIVGALIVAQLMIWAILHFTHLDNRIYELINV